MRLEGEVKQVSELLNKCRSRNLEVSRDKAVELESKLAGEMVGLQTEDRLTVGMMVMIQIRIKENEKMGTRERKRI